MMLLTASPVIHAAGSDAPDCATANSASSDNGGDTDTSTCSIECLVSPAAAIAKAAESLATAPGASPIEHAKASEKSLAWPPDTAPPKFLSA